MVAGSGAWGAAAGRRTMKELWARALQRLPLTGAVNFRIRLWSSFRYMITSVFVIVTSFLRAWHATLVASPTIWEPSARSFLRGYSIARGDRDRSEAALRGHLALSFSHHMRL